MPSEPTLSIPSLSRRRLRAAAAVVPLAAALPLPTAVTARAGLTTFGKIGESIIARNASSSRYVNGHSFQLDAIITHAGWQYATFYVDSGRFDTSQVPPEPIRHVAVGRRQLPDGPWTLLVLDDYEQTKRDDGNGGFHRTISLGVCPIDGTLHLAFDSHSDQGRYRRSVPGVLSNPESFAWEVSDFEPVTGSIGPHALTRTTYPYFVTTPTGNLLFSHRDSTVRSAAQVFIEYDGSAHVWSNDATRVLASPNPDPSSKNNRSAYPNGLTYDHNGRLHMTWTWRILPQFRTVPDPFGNFDIMYAYSDDDGRTWHNNDDELLVLPISDYSSPSARVFEVPEGSSVLNNEGQTVDRYGNLHLIMRHETRVNGDDRVWHYHRRAYGGYWSRRDTGLRQSELGPRVKIVTDRFGNAYIVAGNLRIFAAYRKSIYGTWYLVSEPTDLGRFSASPLYDRVRLTDGVLSILYQAKRDGPEQGSISSVDYQLIN